MRRILVFIALTIPALAADFPPYSPELKARAEAGDSDSQHDLGRAYHQGLGTGVDFEAARVWYEKAVAQDNGKSWNNLGLLYLHGKGVERDLDRAKQCFEHALRKGIGVAEKNLDETRKEQMRQLRANRDDAYPFGRPDPQDELKDPPYSDALRERASAGDAESQYNLGRAFHEGRGIATDDAAAKQWYERAAAQGYAKGWYNLGILHENGQGVPRSLPEAKRLYQKAVSGNVFEARNRLLRVEARIQRQEYLARINGLAKTPSTDSGKPCSQCGGDGLIDEWAFGVMGSNLCGRCKGTGRLEPDAR